MSLKQQSPTFLTQGRFFERQFFHGQGWDGSYGVIQVHYLYRVLYFYYYYINSTSDHQALVPEVGDPCHRGFPDTV